MTYYGSPLSDRPLRRRRVRHDNGPLHRRTGDQCRGLTSRHRDESRLVATSGASPRRPHPFPLLLRSSMVWASRSRLPGPVTALARCDRSRQIRILPGHQRLHRSKCVLMIGHQACAIRVLSLQTRLGLPQLPCTLTRPVSKRRASLRMVMFSSRCGRYSTGGRVQDFGSRC
jgi:hypothetical protein